ncbi:unnamed protein product [Paramecium pentaurelia]|uniref:Uncharacterized protein n=1 Tax=Paramecium pentaurelia TaxID=43138 RepID=A0A8S1THF9_9CILI|nr:unnamed protein product [Paramecium pentaurelia]
MYNPILYGIVRLCSQFYQFMNQCLNKLLESLDHMYESLFQKLIEIFARRGIIRPLIRRPAVPVIELQPIDHSLKQPLLLHSCIRYQSIYRRAESEKNFRQYMIPNLGDTIYKVDSYSRDISLLNLFEDKQEQEQYQNLNLQDIHKKRNKLQTIIEENKIYSNNHEGYQSQNQSQQITKQQQQLSNSNLHIEKQQLPNVNFQELDENEQFYSIIDNTVKITQSEQFFSIIDRSSFRLSFNIQYSQK